MPYLPAIHMERTLGHWPNYENDNAIRTWVKIDVNGADSKCSPGNERVNSC